jgi:hypothetical protein
LKTGKTLGIIEKIDKRKGGGVMGGRGGFFTDGTRYIISGICFILFIAVVMIIPKDLKRDETWRVEAHIVKKEVAQTDSGAVYLLHTEDSEGNEATYQIVQEALNERMTAEDVHKQIRRGRYYRLKLTDGEPYGCDYPVICGAATLIDGFTEESSTSLD